MMMNLQPTAHAFLTHGTPWHTSNVTVPIEDWHFSTAPGASMLGVDNYPYPDEIYHQRKMKRYMFQLYSIYYLEHSYCAITF